MSHKSSGDHHFPKSTGLALMQAVLFIQARFPDADYRPLDVIPDDPAGWDHQTALMRTVLVEFVDDHGSSYVVQVSLWRESVSEAWQILSVRLKMEVPMGTQLLDMSVVEAARQSTTTERYAHWQKFVRVYNRGTQQNPRPKFQVFCVDYHTGMSYEFFAAWAQVQMWVPTTSGAAVPELLSIPYSLFLTGLGLSLKAPRQINEEWLFGVLNTEGRFLGINQFFKLEPSLVPGYLPKPHNHSNGQYGSSIEMARFADQINAGGAWRLVIPGEYFMDDSQGTIAPVRLTPGEIATRLEIELQFQDHADYVFFPRVSLGDFYMMASLPFFTRQTSLSTVIEFLEVLPGYDGVTPTNWVRSFEFPLEGGGSITLLANNSSLYRHNEPHILSAFELEQQVANMAWYAKTSMHQGQMLAPGTFEAAWSCPYPDVAVYCLLSSMRDIDLPALHRTIQAIEDTIYLKSRMVDFGIWLSTSPLTQEQFLEMYEAVQSAPLSGSRDYQNIVLDIAFTIDPTLQTELERRRRLAEYGEHWYDKQWNDQPAE